MSEQNASNGASRFDPLGVLWRLAAAPQSLMLLLALVVVALVLAYTIPQIPSQATSNPEAWLATQSTNAGPLNRIVRALHLYDIYHAIWFHLLLAVTGLVIFVWLFDAAELAWRASGRAEWRAGDVALFGLPVGRARLLLPSPRRETQDRLQDWSRTSPYRCSMVTTSSDKSWVLGRRTYLLWLQPLALGALLLALVGLVIAGTWGWQNEDWMPAPGERRSVGHGQSVAIQLESFQPPPQEQSLQQYESHLTWTLQDGSSQAGTAGFGRPARLGGIAARQIDYAPIVQLTALDRDGNPLALQASGAELSTLGAVEIALLAPEEQPLVYLPTLDIFLGLRFEPWCQAQGPVLYVDQLQSGESGAAAIGSVQERGTLDTDDFRLEVNLTYRPVLRVDSRPGMALVVGGLLVAIVALTVGWLAEPQLVWLILEPGKEEVTSIRLLVPPVLRTNRGLSALISRLHRELSHDS